MNANNDPVIVSAVRTPVGKAPRGALREIRPDDLAAAVIRAGPEALHDQDDQGGQDSGEEQAGRVVGLHGLTGQWDGA